MTQSRLSELECSIGRTVAIVGQRWTPVILRAIFEGRRRFDAIQEELGIARNILSDRRRTLEAHGILERKHYSTHPPRQEYQLTAKGMALWPVLVTLMAWGDRFTSGEAGPPVILRHAGCGQDTNPYLVCSHCEESIAARAVSWRAGPGVLWGEAMSTEGRGG